MGRVVVETTRLLVRTATEEDAEFYFRLWIDPRVMRFVGFPHGLKITLDEVRNQIRAAGDSPFDRRLVVVLRATGESIGEAKLHRPDGNGVAKTDVKLLPSAWGHRYGTEVKAGLIQYLFEHTDCRAVEGTPNKENTASIRMQEAVGGVCVGEGVFEFPEEMRGWTCPVPHFVYHVRRTDWSAGRIGAAARGGSGKDVMCHRQPVHRTQRTEEQGSFSRGVCPRAPRPSRR